MPGTKRCFKCGLELPLDDFYRHPAMNDGHLGKCKECTKRDVSERYRATRAERMAYERRRSQNPARRERWKLYGASPGARMRKRASTMAANAVRSGRLIKRPCEVCGTTESVRAHHDDYSKPLDVRWLCFRHHR